MSSTLIVAGSVYAPGIPDAQAILINDGEISWIGDRQTASQFRQDATKFLDLEDAFVSPGFVDAHVHLSATGLNVLGFNASAAGSFAELAWLVNNAVTSQKNDYIYLQGWDDSRWRDSVEDFEIELSSQARQRTFYLARIDGHSALVNGPWLDGGPAQIVSGSVREKIWNQLALGTSDDLISECVKSALKLAASNGVVAVHENGGPTVSSVSDFELVQSFSNNTLLPAVHTYWADLNPEIAVQLGALGAAGDLSVDGSIGSRTAKMFKTYSDVTDTSGLAYLDTEQIAEHIVATTLLGIQGGFHAIGDEACERVHQGFQLALDQVSVSQIRATRHRIEHLTMPSADSLRLYAELGVMASVQPAFDATWGREGGMYETRLGAERLSATHPFADMIKAGMVLAFGSDSPVTGINPWDWVRSANQHNQIDQQISLRAAFNAATRGGHRAARNDASGVLEVGAPADLAVWQVAGFTEPVSNNTAASWSTDPRSGTHALPDLDLGDPDCLMTLRNGVGIFDPAGLFDD